MKKVFAILFLTLGSFSAWADYIFIPMDLSQKDHLKAYGVAYFVLQNQVDVDWLLNYRGGSFMFTYSTKFEAETNVRGVTYEVISDASANGILQQISGEDVNMDVVKLEKAPRMAIYVPPTADPWDDAVMLALTYAEIPFDKIFNEEVLRGDLKNYDWLHLHHEDFTGQYGRFWASYQNQQWYRNQVAMYEAIASRLGYTKVSLMQLDVAKKIKEWIFNGGFMFAMCSATDSYDIALAAEGLDICESMFDGDGTTTDYNSKLDYSKTLAFQNFKLKTNPIEYEFSDIDVTQTRNNVSMQQDYFTLFEFSAKWDPVPTMLCQDHTTTIKGFMGQTTAFKKDLIKPEVLIMGELKNYNEARYIHGTYGYGTWSWYAGHDPEDYQHIVGDPPTDLSLHKNSPGYRLILNNVLFPAAKKKKQKT